MNEKDSNENENQFTIALLIEQEAVLFFIIDSDEDHLLSYSYCCALPVGLNFNLTYGLKPQVSGIKIVHCLQTIHFPN